MAVRFRRYLYESPGFPGLSERPSDYPAALPPFFDAVRARHVVANDTGISHIAAALKAPSVIVARGSEAVEEVIGEARSVIASKVGKLVPMP